MWSSHWHRVSKSAFLAMADYLFITGSHAHSVLWQARDPGGGEDLFFFFFLLVSSAPPIRQGYPRCAILQQGMHLNVFSKVYYDRVYFSCAERIMTGSGFDPPAAPPYPLEKSSAPPPPRTSHREKVLDRSLLIVHPLQGHHKAPLLSLYAYARPDNSHVYNKIMQRRWKKCVDHRQGRRCWKINHIWSNSTSASYSYLAKWMNFSAHRRKSY